MESEIRILLSIESLNIFHSTSKKELAKSSYLCTTDFFCENGAYLYFNAS